MMSLETCVNSAVSAAQHSLRDAFAQAQPFRHVAIDEFFTEDFCRQLVAEFPPFDERRAIDENGEVGAKAVHEQIAELGPAWRALDSLVQSAGFRGLISGITGIDDLRYDPHYFGGGTHENLHGQGLSAHIDFNLHPFTRQHRRLNLIVYLSEEWRDEWGGSIQLHRDPQLPPSEDEVVTITPVFNRCVIFETNEQSWHGFPRIDLPDDKRHLSRRSFALYYYTDSRPADEVAPEHSTIYVDEHLPEDYQPGMQLDAAGLQHIRSLLASRDQHIRRLYEDIKRLNVQLAELRSDQERQRRHMETTVHDDPERLLRTMARLQARVEEFEHSTSWRVTAPLRAIKRLFRRT